jgi:hypothetical protein
MDSAKVFIDTDNEITFILEKILSSKSEKVCLVVPDRAAIFTSISGLKLIKRMLDKSGKLLVLVTLDPNGADLSKKAGLFVVSRVGEITEELWEQVNKSKFEAIKKDTKKVFYLPETPTEKAKEADSKSAKPETKMSLSDLLEDTLAAENSTLVVAETVADAAPKDVPTIRIKVANEDIESVEEAPIEIEPVQEETIAKDPWQETLEEQTEPEIEIPQKLTEEIHILEEAEESFEKKETEASEPIQTTRQRKRVSSDVEEPITINFLEGEDLLGQKKN